MKDIGKRTRKEFKALPHRERFNTDIWLIDWLVIYPTRHKHGSGFRVMELIAVVAGIPTCKVSWCSDVIGLEGIGWLWTYDPDTRAWKRPHEASRQIDCLGTSWLMYLFCRKKIKIGQALSSFSVYSVDKEEKSLWDN